MNDIIIREIEPADNPIVAKLIRRVFEEYGAPREGTVYSDPATDNLYALFRAPASVFWVATHEGAIAGCCGVYPTEGLPAGYAELVKFYLSPDARGKGIGKNLLQKCIKWAGKTGYTHLYIESMPAFANAVRIYEKIGFQQLDHSLGNSGHVSCDIWMLKKLD